MHARQNGCSLRKYGFGESSLKRLRFNCGFYELFGLAVFKRQPVFSFAKLRGRGAGGPAPGFTWLDAVAPLASGGWADVVGFAVEGGGLVLSLSDDRETCLADPAAFVRALAAKLAPDGLMILSTPNRTPMSRLAMITIGESVGGIPRGTHDWDKFLTPDELTELLHDAGMVVDDVTGLSLDPARGFILSDNRSINYLLTARKAA